MDVIALDSFREGCASEILDYLVPACDDAIDDDREVFGLFETSFFTIKHDPQVIAVVDDAIELSRIELVIRGHELDPARENRYLPTVIFIKFRIL